MVAGQSGSPVLLVGDVGGGQLAMELASFGLPTATAGNANDAVARMKTTRFPYVVVPPVLVDMGGVDFIHGVLRHFDANVVLYGNGVESSEINALLRTGRVAHFPAHADGHVVADFLARRASGSTPPSSGPTNTPQPSIPQASTPPRQPPPLTGPIPGAAGPAPSKPSFNLTPGAASSASPMSSSSSSLPMTATPVPSLSAQLFGNAATTFPSVSPGQQSLLRNDAIPGAGGHGFADAVHATPQPSRSPIPSSTPGFAPTPSGGFPPMGGASSSAVPRPPTMTPISGVGAAGGIAAAHFEQMVDELAKANSDLVVLRTKLQAAEQEKLSLVAEVEAARRSAIADVAQVMALSDEGDPIAEELEDLKNKVLAAEMEREAKAQEAEGLRKDRDNLVAEIAEKATKIAGERARADAADAALADAKKNADEAKSEAGRLRMDLEKANADVLSLKRDLDEEAKALEEAEARLMDAQKAKADVETAALAQAGEAAAALEREKAEALAALERDKQEAIAALEREKAEALVVVEKKRADEAAGFELVKQELDKRVATLEAQRADLAAALDAKQNELAAAAAASSGKSDAESALRLELEKMRADVNSARTDATTVRLDLQEALMRLDESAQSLSTLTQERDALRAEAGPLRDWANQVVAQQQQQQGELERMRALADAAESRGKAIHELQAQIDKLQEERDKARASVGSGAGGDVEVVLARSRQLADLVRALEPFMWGLTQATGFYTKAGIAGGDVHLKLLQQLQGVLLRLRDEIAMLDLG